MTTTRFARHTSSLGELLLVGEVTAEGTTVLTGCYLPDHRRRPAIDPGWREDADAFTRIAAALDAHLGGDPAATRVVPIAFAAGTPFQRRTWQALQAIPAGATVTYGELAIRLGRPGAARAVGSAVARNPISIVVPCHRVVGADGSLTGYAGGVAAKRRLLEVERGLAPVGARGGAVAAPESAAAGR